MAATRDTSNSSWIARPLASRLIRLVAMVLPLAIGCAVALAANEALPMAHATWLLVGRMLLVAAIVTLTVRLGDRAARKLLPLAALLRLSLVFPDHAPSRFRSALKAGSSRRLQRAVEATREGLPADPGAAARQVVEMIGVLGDHDRRTRGHSERVRLYADLIGEEMGLSKLDRQKLQWGALLHDLGKLCVPGQILNKDGKPDAEEWEILRGHPDAGMELIEPLRDFLGEWVHAIGGHHEKWDGSGYPKGLAGRDIPRAAAIVAVADSFEVMTAVRSYKSAMPISEARAELTRCAGQHFSPEVVRAFLEISLGKVRLAAGPVAALAHLPFLGNAMQVPTMIAGAVPAAASSVAIPLAAATLAVPGVAAADESVPPTPPPTTAVVAVSPTTEPGAAGRSARGRATPSSTVTIQSVVPTTTTTTPTVPTAPPPTAATPAAAPTAPPTTRPPTPAPSSPAVTVAPGAGGGGTGGSGAAPTTTPGSQGSGNSGGGNGGNSGNGHGNGNGNGNGK